MKCENLSCGLLWLDPAPFRDDLHLAYQQYLTHESPQLLSSGRKRLESYVERACLQRWLNYPFGLSAAHTLFGSVLAMITPAGIDGFMSSAMFLHHPIGNRRLLDVGCGDGTFMARMRSFGWIPEGVDFDPIALDQAKAKGLTVFEGGIATLKQMEAPFDAIVLSHVIEHLPNATEVIRQCEKLLAPGGCLALLTPNSESLGFRIFHENWRGLEPPRHLCIYNQRILTNMIIDAGLIPEFVTTSARGARYILGYSLALREMRKTGAHKLKINLWMRVLAITLQQLERIALQFSRAAGEEIFLVARKRAT
ncbi:MAG: class I SAM-dependent methyltransferase [Holophagaceae bacterium]|uniref:Class I SAM-dependent methyltransferase n=1 Tax=Candidatus Geothrix skivensis TaxID=2954439 RepID=A0A9D7SCB5_9BACT|nr:class I SAM-dependent methyltransferase [Candidatus Geothrix skivensis]